MRCQTCCELPWRCARSLGSLGEHHTDRRKRCGGQTEGREGQEEVGLSGNETPKEKKSRREFELMKLNIKIQFKVKLTYSKSQDLFSSS